MSRYFLGSLIFIIALLMNGCSDKKESKEVKENLHSSASAKIEVVANKNAREIKVKTEQTQKTTSKNSKSYYYDYGKKSKQDQSTRARTRLDAYSHIRSPYERVQVSLIMKQLSHDFKIKCSACHDDYANGVVGPSLLGKDENYIYEKIMAFKTGKKNNPLMTDLLKTMSKKDIKDISKQIYEFNVRIQNLRIKK